VIDLGAAFNTDLIALAGWNPDTIDPASLTVSLVNTTGPTTVRATVNTNVDSDALRALITKYATPTDTETTSPAPEPSDTTSTTT
jgi:hypothetical protein